MSLALIWEYGQSRSQSLFQLCERTMWLLVWDSYVTIIRLVSARVGFVMWAAVSPPNLHRSSVILAELENPLQLGNCDLMT